MKGSFNDYYLVYDEINPLVSIINNKDKIIIKGNSFTNKVYIIYYYNQQFINYFFKHKYPSSMFINYNEFNKNSFVEQINNDSKNYNRLNNLFINYNLNKKICLAYDSLQDICLKHNYYLIKPSIILNNSNINEQLKLITSGDIILLDNKMNEENINLLIKEIRYKDYQLANLSEIINE